MKAAIFRSISSGSLLAEEIALPMPTKPWSWVE
jgi:hypothetical protein